MMTSKGGNKIMTLRTPMSADVVGKPHVPPIAANTTISGKSTKSAPISSPQAPFVSMGRKSKR